MEISPKPIYGNWSFGWALDLHTLSSALKDGDIPCLRFASERTEIGEALFRLKYQDDRSQAGPIVETTVAFIRSRAEFSDIGAFLPVPPSDTRRSFQLVPALAAAIGSALGLTAPDDYLLKTRPTRQLKDLKEKKQRREELNGAFGVADRRFAGQHILVFDDLYRSGETLKAVVAALLFEGGAGSVSVVALTATRTKK